MANKFWVGGTGSWSDTTHWATSSGGAGSTGIPATGDAVTFDGASGGGVVTGDVVTGLSLASITAGAFTGTLDFSGTNPNLTLSGSVTPMNFSGTGARKLILGSGTFTFTGTNTVLYEMSTVTNLDALSVFTANFVFSGNTTSNRTFNGGGKTYGSFTVGSNSSRSQIQIGGANTFSSISIAAGHYIIFPQGNTTTVTSALALAGTSSAPITLVSSNTGSGVATISNAGTNTFDWAGIASIAMTGGGSYTATNSLDLGRNTGWTSISVPSGGGGVIGVIGG